MRFEESENFIEIRGSTHHKYTVSAIKKIMRTIDCGFIHGEIWYDNDDELTTYDTLANFLNTLYSNRFHGHFQLVLVKHCNWKLEDCLK